MPLLRASSYKTTRKHGSWVGQKLRVHHFSRNDLLAAVIERLIELEEVQDLNKGKRANRDLTLVGV